MSFPLVHLPMCEILKLGDEKCYIIHSPRVSSINKEKCHNRRGEIRGADHWKWKPSISSLLYFIVIISFHLIYQNRVALQGRLEMLLKHNTSAKPFGLTGFFYTAQNYNTLCLHYIIELKQSVPFWSWPKSFQGTWQVWIAAINVAE